MVRFLRFIAIVGFCLLGLPLFSPAGPTDITSDIETNVGDTASSDNRPPPITNEYGMVFVYIPPGEFLMGSPPDEPGRQPNEHRHKVILSQGFYMMTTEVTQKQWTAVMEDNPSAFSDCGPDCPVENVAWTEVNRFIKRLNSQAKVKIERSAENQPLAEPKNRTGDVEQDPPGRLRYRLPTEAQWEYACRAGSRGWFYFGGDIWDLNGYAWYKNNADGQPHPVARKKANAFGLYDVHGNVWEWCQDYARAYPTKISIDPSGPAKGSFRVARGGSWYYPALEARSANRLYLAPDVGNYNVGFRLVMISDR